MRVLTETVGPLATASANNICLSQAGTANTNLTINGALVSGGVATLDTARRVIVTSAGNDSGITFKLSGTNGFGMPVSETLAGANGGAAQSVNDFATITGVIPSGNTAANVTVGTNGVASTRPICLDSWAFPQVSLQVDVTGTVNATVQQTLDNINVAGPANVNWINHADAALVNLTATVQGNYAYMPVFVRLLLNSGSGSAAIKILQAASHP